MYISKPSAGGGQAVCLGQWVQVQWETLNQNTRCVTSRKDSQHHLDAHARECIHAPHRDIHNTVSPHTRKHLLMEWRNRASECGVCGSQVTVSWGLHLKFQVSHYEQEWGLEPNRNQSQAHTQPEATCLTPAPSSHQSTSAILTALYRISGAWGTTTTLPPDGWHRFLSKWHPDIYIAI